MSQALEKQLALKIAAVRPELEMDRIGELAQHLASKRIGSLNGFGELFFTGEDAIRATEIVPGLVTSAELTGDAAMTKIARARLRLQEHERTQQSEQRTAGLTAHQKRMARAQRIAERCKAELPTCGLSGVALKAERAKIRAGIIREEIERDRAS